MNSYSELAGVAVIGIVEPALKNPLEGVTDPSDEGNGANWTMY